MKYYMNDIANYRSIHGITISGIFGPHAESPIPLRIDRYHRTTPFYQMDEHTQRMMKYFFKDRIKYSKDEERWLVQIVQSWLRFECACTRTSTRIRRFVI